MTAERAAILDDIRGRFHQPSPPLYHDGSVALLVHPRVEVHMWAIVHT